MAALWKHFRDGGWGMYPIVLWSIITIGIIIERALYLFGSSINKDVAQIPRAPFFLETRGTSSRANQSQPYGFGTQWSVARSQYQSPKQPFFWQLVHAWHAAETSGAANPLQSPASSVTTTTPASSSPASSRSGCGKHSLSGRSCTMGGSDRSYATIAPI